MVASERVDLERTWQTADMPWVLHALERGFSSW
jgi:hypothetical protein